MVLVHRSLAPSASQESIPEIPIRVERLKLARRLWRGAADDGKEFGFELEQPLSDGDLVWAGPDARYVICQKPEPVLEIKLSHKPDVAALLGWIVGNLHFVVETRPTHLLAPDDSALRLSLQRLGITFRETVEVFKPHRLAASIAHSHAPAGAAAEHPYIRPRGLNP